MNVTLLHFVVMILHVRGIGVENPEIWRKIFLLFFTIHFVQERKKIRFRNNSNPELDHEPGTGGREKEDLFMPNILEKPSKNTLFSDREGSGNTAKIDRLSSYLPREHWYCKL